jgi:hypothetical protein
MKTVYERKIEISRQIMVSFLYDKFSLNLIKNKKGVTSPNLATP